MQVVWPVRVRGAWFPRVRERTRRRCALANPNVSLFVFHPDVASQGKGIQPFEGIVNHLFGNGNDMSLAATPFVQCDYFLLHFVRESRLSEV